MHNGDKPSGTDRFPSRALRDSDRRNDFVD